MSEAGVIESTAPQAPAVPAAPAAPAAPAEAAPSDQKTPEQATETSQDAPAKTDEQPPKPGKSSFERRLDKAYRKAAEAQARADFYERRDREREQALKQEPKNGALKLEDFDFDAEKFSEAVANDARAKLQAELAQRQQAERTAAAQRRVTQTWAKHVAKGEDTYDDWDIIVGDLKPVTPWSHAVMLAENAADLAYYLGTHMQEATAIAAMEPMAQVRAVARLEAKLLAEPPKPKISAAPAPIKPLGGANARSDKKLSEMSQDKFEKRRREQIAKRR